MNILGISCYYHDSSACLMKDGKIIAAAEEERFTRKKHDTGFPLNAIRYCMVKGELNIEDIDYVAFYEKPVLKFERMLSSHLQTYPFGFWQFFKALPSWITEKLRLPTTLRKKVGFENNIIYSNHHLSHAASAFLCSPYKSAAIITCDGVGEWGTTTIGIGKNNSVKILKEIQFPHSLGLLYSAITAFLGFKVNNDEYKVMGLASYGKPSYKKVFENIIKVNNDGSFSLNMKYFSYHYKNKMFSKKIEKLLGKPRKSEGPIASRHKDIAATVQKIAEDIMIKTANHAYELTGEKNLCMAGGVALNSVANGKLLSTKFKNNIFIQPAAGDAGGCVGAALYAYNHVLKRRRSYKMDHVYLGPEFSREYIKKLLIKKNIKFKELEDKELFKKVAGLIHKNYIIGWYQGRMEYGPRALGNRSILANPCNPKMKDILNKRVKHREEFRPFAPVVPIEDEFKYFDTKKEIPYMLFVCPVQKDKKKAIPSVTHVDGSARLQTVRKEVNPRYYGLIKAFEKITGVPVIINTSFNVRGEPIVCNPTDAINCAANTGIDYLVLENFFIDKKDLVKK